MVDFDELKLSVDEFKGTFISNESVGKSWKEDCIIKRKTWNQRKTEGDLKRRLRSAKDFAFKGSVCMKP